MLLTVLIFGLSNFSNATQAESLVADFGHEGPYFAAHTSVESLDTREMLVCPANTTSVDFQWAPADASNVWSPNDSSNSYTMNYTDINGNPATIDVDVTMTDPANRNEDDDSRDVGTHPFDAFGGCDVFTGGGFANDWPTGDGANDPWGSDCNGDGSVGGLDFRTQSAGLYGDPYLTWVMKSADHTEVVTLNFEFSKDVFMDNFEVSDIDYSGVGYEEVANLSIYESPGNSFQDEVLFSATDSSGANVAVNINSGTSTIVTGQDVRSIYNLNMNGNLAPTDPAGTVQVSTSDKFSTLSVGYSNGIDDAIAEQNDPADYAWWSNTNGATNGVSDNHAVRMNGFTFCVVEPGEITGTVLEDTDGDGVGDTPISGVVLELLDSAGNPVLDDSGNPITVTTDANGDYIFTDVPGLEDYFVREQQPAGYSDVSEVDGGDDGDNADNGVTNLIPVTVGPGETDSGNDFVEELPGAISGNVSEDTNGDGGADQPIAGVVLELLDDAGNPVLDDSGNPITATTDANGDFLFSDVPPGDYTVVEQQPAGYSDVSEAEGGDDGDNPDNGVLNSIDVTVSPGETDTGNDFIEEIPGAISGNVTEDTDGDGVGDTPIEGVVMELLDSAGNPVLDDNGDPITTTTDANGDYSFPDVSPGDYLVNEQQPADYQDVSEVDGGDDGDNPDNGVTNSIPVTVDPGETDTGNDFIEELIPGAITGNVTADTNGDGNADLPLEDVVLELLDENGDPVLDDNGDPITTTTDANGDYSFTDVPPGDYQVAEQQPEGYADQSEVDGGDDGDNPDNGVINNIPVTVDAGETDTGNNFIEELEPTAVSVSGSSATRATPLVLVLMGMLALAVLTRIGVFSRN